MRVLPCLVLLGCGRLGFDGTVDAAASDTATDGEAPMLGPPFISVDPRTLPAFGTPQLVSELSLDGVEDDDPCLTRDQLEIFFDRQLASHELYTSRRASIDDPWPAPTPILELSTSADEEQPQISGDGLTLYFLREGANRDRAIYRARRASRGSAWTDVERVTELDSPEDEDMGSVSADDRVLVMSSKRGGLTTDMLYEAQRSGPHAPWSSLRELAELNTNNYDRSGHLDDFGLVLYYERSGTLRWSRRDSIDATWAPSLRIAELEESGIQVSDPWLSPDLRTLYFVRSIGGDNATRDIYMVTR